jgi:hypothetical protein
MPLPGGLGYRRVSDGLARDKPGLHRGHVGILLRRFLSTTISSRQAPTCHLGVSEALPGPSRAAHQYCTATRACNFSRPSLSGRFSPYGPAHGQSAAGAELAAISGKRTVVRACAHVCLQGGPNCVLLSTLNGLENGALEHTSSGAVRILRPGGSRLVLVAGRLLTAGRWPQGVWSLGACCPLASRGRKPPLTRARRLACLSCRRPPHTRPTASSPMRKLRKTAAVDRDGNVVTIPRLPSVRGTYKPPGWNRWSAAEKVEHLGLNRT